MTSDYHLSRLEQLIRFGTRELSPPLESTDLLPVDLAWLYRKRNGFVTPNGELLVRPFSNSPGGLPTWNAPTTWKNSYPRDLENLYFFAENVLGSQFALSQGSFYQFEPFTGEITLLASSLEQWGAYIIDHYDQATGFTLAEEWTISHGFKSPWNRLGQIIPAILGGSLDSKNLFETSSEEIITFASDVYRKTKDLPDGSEVRFTTRRVRS